MMTISQWNRPKWGDIKHEVTGILLEKIKGQYFLSRYQPEVPQFEKDLIRFLNQVPDWCNRVVFKVSQTHGKTRMIHHNLAKDKTPEMFKKGLTTICSVKEIQVIWV